MAKLTIRTLHKVLAPIVLLPLLITVVTGMGYQLGEKWLGFTHEQVHFLIVIHQGDYLGDTLESFYIFLNGLGVLWMLGTGATLLINPWWKKWRNASTHTNKPLEN